MRLEACGINAAGPAAFADQHRLIAIEFVFGDEIVDDRDHLVGGDIEDGARGVLDGFADEVRERSDRAPRRLGIAVSMQAGLGVAEHVGRAGVGDGIARAIGRAHRDVVVGIVGLRLEELDCGIDDILGLGKGGIGKSGDVGAARSDIDDGLPLRARTMLPPAMPITRTSSELT